MDPVEQRVVQENFAYLVKEGKAAYMLDELFSLNVIDLDDLQRVEAQITDSDKMRMLLVILLKKVRTSNAQTFQALLYALEKSRREDIADALRQHHRTVSSGSVLPNQVGQPVAAGNRDNQFGGFTFSSEFPGKMMPYQREGINVADAAQKTQNGEVTQNTTMEELSTPPSNIPAVAELPVVSREELKKAVESVKDSSGQLYLGGRRLQYEMKGLYQDGQLRWRVKVFDPLSNRTVEKTEEDRLELLEKCLKEFVG